MIFEMVMRQCGRLPVLTPVTSQSYESVQVVLVITSQLILTSITEFHFCF